ncbi:hypothetical protein OMW55_07835 [Sphingomonas sp. BN140010]|uniref:Uncharacterized protein n=1 Tax=Sphingomonas arvum TaxID=2992113 RepID=A0ABT3JF61_9SPHN|nr:hypothetical protein [Sphingomonas sp. BN140010]MCW3797712.1 hypothetical protein [Sphingomonas sp. BN140010]
MMRSAARAAMAAMVLMTNGTALAADGRLGPTSSTSLSIRVSVAPRAWQANSDTLCVAGPPAGFSLRPDQGSAPLRWRVDERGACAARATQLRLDDASTGVSTILLVVPE